MLEFYLRSLFTRYGWLFIRHVAVFRPFKTIKAFFKSLNLKSKNMLIVGDKHQQSIPEQAVDIVGTGFCLKPKNPPCPSKNDLHGCKYLEEYYFKKPDIPSLCKNCYIRKTGLAALRSNSAFYIMTSARDILFDVFKPSLNYNTYSSGLFMLCRYSFKPFFIGMYASGIKGFMFAFSSGDCSDYKTWLKADRGEKDDMTQLDNDSQKRIEHLLDGTKYDNDKTLKFIKKANVFYPVSFFE